MIKCIALIRRRAGLSHAAFRDYYENHHAPLAAPYLAAALRYERRYLEPDMLAHGTGATAAASGKFDCITELWFADRDTMNRTLAALATPAVAAVIVPDEERFVDRASIRFFVVEEECMLSG